MTRDRKHINMVRDLGDKHEAYHKAKKDYDKAKAEVEKFNGKETNTYGLYTITYEDTTDSRIDWEEIAEALGMTEKEARNKFTKRTPSKRFKGVTER